MLCCLVQEAEWTCPPMDSWDFGSDGDPAADGLAPGSAAAPCDAPTEAQEVATATAAAATAAAAAAPVPLQQQPPDCRPPAQQPQRQPDRRRRQQQAGQAEAAGSSRVCVQAPAGWLPAHRMVVPRSAVFYCASFCALPGLPHTRALLTSHGVVDAAVDAALLKHGWGYIGPHTHVCALPNPRLPRTRVSPFTNSTQGHDYMGVVAHDGSWQVLADWEHYQLSRGTCAHADVLMRARSQRSGVQALCAAIFDVRNCVCRPEVCDTASTLCASHVCRGKECECDFE
jgi:hypothetical protein